MNAFKDNTVHSEVVAKKNEGVVNSTRSCFFVRNESNEKPKSVIRKEYILQEIDTLCQNEYFCDFELIHQVEMLNTFYAYLPTDLIVNSFICFCFIK